jgi:copper(I)-binding protein
MQMIRQALAPLAAGLLFLVAHGGVLAQPQKPQVENVWASATVPGQPVGAAYMRITSRAPLSLIRIETPVASRVQVHTMHTDKGVMKMREVTELAIPAAQPISLAPGNTHLMLLGLKKPLKAGESFPLTLTFRHADKQESRVTVHVPIRPMGS